MFDAQQQLARFFPVFDAGICGAPQSANKMG